MYKQIEHVFALQKLPEKQASSHQTQVLLASSSFSSSSFLSMRCPIQDQSCQNKGPQEQQEEVIFHLANFGCRKFRAERVEHKKGCSMKSLETKESGMAPPLASSQHNMKNIIPWTCLPPSLFKGNQQTQAKTMLSKKQSHKALACKGLDFKKLMHPKFMHPKFMHSKLLHSKFTHNSCTQKFLHSKLSHSKLNA